MRMACLLDTCAAMYLVSNEPMATEALAAMDASADHGIPLRVSPITAWEVGMQQGKGRFRSSLTPQRWFEMLRTRPGITLCELTPEILLGSSFLPGMLNRDPADRIIAATAREFGYTVITRDRALLDYAAQGHIAVIEC
ncbi:MAG: type II toxin-antitoxin system VapC family toxin [Alphaproteobacteria bacterium]|nr:type II toxin-antitoxin system VapC family toxin [Alphaproteobacteria bacterium]